MCVCVCVCTCVGIFSYLDETIPVVTCNHAPGQPAQQLLALFNNSLISHLVFVGSYPSSTNRSYRKGRGLFVARKHSSCYHNIMHIHVYVYYGQIHRLCTLPVIPYECIS